MVKCPLGLVYKTLQKWKLELKCIEHYSFYKLPIEDVYLDFAKAYIEDIDTSESTLTKNLNSFSKECKSSQMSKNQESERSTSASSH